MSGAFQPTGYIITMEGDAADREDFEQRLQRFLDGIPGPAEGGYSTWWRKA